MSKISSACQRGILLIFLSTSATCIWTYPDLSCVNQQNPSSHAWHAQFCQSDQYRLNTRLNTVCYERCMLEELKILNVDWMDWDAGLVRYRFYNYTERSYNVGLSVILGKEEAEKYSKQISQRCNTILNDLANLQKLACREWDSLYSCVNEVFGCQPYQPLPA